jgi:hypothetical protein
LISWTLKTIVWADSDAVASKQVIKKNAFFIVIDLWLNTKIQNRRQSSTITAI